MNYITPQHRYYTLDYYLKDTFNSKVFKVALNGNFTCPNRDGTISHNGCIFCSENGSGEFGGKKTDSLTVQFASVKTMIHEKWPNAKYIVYFQANTNTYAPLEKLKSLYEEAINLSENIVAISIATRPDCINKDIINYLSDLNKKIPVWIELGLQTIHDKTAKEINRGYELDVFENCVKSLRESNITTIVHIINGLPHETKQMMIDTVKYLNTCDIQGIKIHSLFVLKNTVLANDYLNKKFNLQTMNEYIDVTCEQLAYLNKSIVVHRISGDPPKDIFIAPEWCLKKFVVMNEIDKEMKRRNYYQGIKSNF